VHTPSNHLHGGTQVAQGIRHAGVPGSGASQLIGVLISGGFWGEQLEEQSPMYIDYLQDGGVAYTSISQEERDQIADSIIQDTNRNKKNTLLEEIFGKIPNGFSGLLFLVFLINIAL
jgi:hypothetical protein